MRTVPKEGAGISLFAAVLSNALPAFRATQDDPAGMADSVDDNAGQGSGEGNGASGTGGVEAPKRTGRFRSGESHHMSRQSDEDVREMRRMRDKLKASYAAIGVAFGCSPWTVRSIVTRKSRRKA